MRKGPDQPDFDAEKKTKALSIALKITRLWKLNDEEAATVLNIAPADISQYKEGVALPDDEVLQRISYLARIFKQLQSIYEPTQADLWIKKHNQQIEGGISALEFIQNRGIDALQQLAEYLDKIVNVDPEAYDQKLQ